METKKVKISIRVKVVITIIISTLFLAALVYSVSNNLVFDSYLKLENSQMEMSTKRVDSIFKDSIYQLSTKLSDWSVWDDSYKFVQDNNQAFVEANLADIALVSLNIQTIGYINNNGKIVYDKVLDPISNQTISSDELTTFLEKNISHFKFTDKDQLFTGIIPLKQGDLIFASRPIVKSSGEGPVAGTVFFGKFIGGDYIKNLELLSQLSIEYFSYNFSTSTQDLLLAKNNLKTSDQYFVAPINEDSIGGYFIVNDINNNPLSIFKVSTTRDIYSQGASTFTFFIEVVFAAVLLFGFIITFFLEYYVQSPFNKLSNEFAEISKTNDLSKKIKVRHLDEIGILGASINSLLEQLYLSKIALDKKVGELDKNNTELGDSKKAIMNLLEDIAREKEHVEEIVTIRTKELSDEKSRLLSSINSLSFGFIIADMNNKVILSNPSIIKIFETESTPATIADLSKMFVGFDLINSCKECLETQKVVEIKEIVLGKKFIRVFCAPVINISEVIGHVIIVEDITEAKVVERSKDEFFSIASHELRTPLTAIRGNADMILDMYIDKIPDTDVREMLSDIDNASVRLINIVNDFLEVSRLEQGQVETKKITFDVSTIIAKVVKDLTGMAEKKKSVLNYSLPATPLPMVAGDPGRTEQVLINLIGNAIKFTDNGTVSVSTEIRNNFLAVKVTDTGIGIDIKNQSLLFRKFQQAGQKILARNDSNSTGLGLYISKLLVSNMGGDIKLENSVLGTGSTFVFTLPIVV